MIPDGQNGDRVEQIQALCRHIEQHPEEPLTLADLGRRLKLSPAHAQRVFKRVMGITPRQYLDACRISRLKARLKAKGTVTMALYEVGFGSSSRLYERAAGQLGMTPGAYRRGGRGMTIRYALTDSPLGRLLLAATERGICAVSLGDRDDLLEAELRREYPAAAIQGDDGTLRDWVEQLLRHLNGQQPDLQLPLDIQATAFQWRVWQALLAIPYGQTSTYSEIARALGQPAAVRAVARACATNPVSIVIPCHRVVREDGDLAGYRWGIERKKQLLARERDHAGE
jgi:AraC family transcriptional regulator of adaptative response/methylated-DNA-[protein]-cysteine methyltransferase